MNEELQLAVMGYIVATKKLPKSEQEINTIAQQVIRLKQLDPQQYSQLVQLGQLAKQQMAQQQSVGVKAKLGTKLNYINKLKGNCPEGTEKVYLAKGGCMCKQKAKEAELKPKKMNAIEKFKAEKALGGTKFNEKEERRLYAKDMKSAKDQAAKDSIQINKYSDLETLEKSGHKGSYKTKDGSIWTPDRSKYKTEKKACGSKLKKRVTKHWGGGVARGGLTNLQYSGTWGNRGQGNQLQSAIERGLSWLGLGPSLKLPSSYYLVDSNGNIVKEVNPVSTGIAPTPGKVSGVNKVATLTTKVGQKLAEKVYKKMPGYAKKSEDFYHADGTWAGTKKPLWADDIDNAFIMESLGGLK